MHNSTVLITKRHPLLETYFSNNEAILVQYGLQLHVTDETSTFVNANLKEDIYLSQPEGLVNHDKKDHVLHLNNTLYGLR